MTCQTDSLDCWVFFGHCFFALQAALTKPRNSCSTWFGLRCSRALRRQESGALSCALRLSCPPSEPQDRTRRLPRRSCGPSWVTSRTTRALKSSEYFSAGVVSMLSAHRKKLPRSEKHRALHIHAGASRTDLKVTTWTFDRLHLSHPQARRAVKLQVGRQGRLSGGT